MKRILALLLSVFLLPACGGLAVKVCYEHPTYGHLCVEAGRVTFPENLTPEDRATLDKWLTEQE